MNQFIYLLKGVTGAGKSTYANKLSIETGAIIVSTDDIRKTYNMSVNSMEAIPKQKIIVEEHLKAGKSVIVDGSNLKKGADNYYLQLGSIYKAKVVLIYLATHPLQWEKNIERRGNDREVFLEIRHKMYGALTFAGIEKFDEVKIIVNDIMEPISGFQNFYLNNRNIFIENPRKFIELLKERFGDIFPEFDKCIGYDQENIHHKQTLDEHILSVAEYLSNKGEDEIMIWSAILHDLGKVVDGIKEVDETGNASYKGHAGASTDIGACVLTRFGFNDDFIFKVLPIVNRHMYIPYEGKLSKNKKNSLGKGIYDKLVIFREADKESKKQ